MKNEQTPRGGRSPQDGGSTRPQDGDVPWLAVSRVACEQTSTHVCWVQDGRWTRGCPGVCGPVTPQGRSPLAAQRRRAGDGHGQTRTDVSPESAQGAAKRMREPQGLGHQGNAKQNHNEPSLHAHLAGGPGGAQPTAELGLQLAPPGRRLGQHTWRPALSSTEARARSRTSSEDTAKGGLGGAPEPKRESCSAGSAPHRPVLTARQPEGRPLPSTCR